MDRRRKVPNPLALVVLAWLLSQPLHPYELGRRLQGSGQDRHIKYTRSSLYMVVEQLARAGFITEQETVRDGQRPERTVYAITDTGRTEFYEWLRGLVAEPQDEYPQFAVALSLLSLLAPREAVALLRKRQEALTTKVEETRKLMQEAIDNGVRWIFLVEEQYALAMMDAESRYLTELTSSLTDPGYIRSWQETFGSIT
ncbi:PadR family transcriptional regulator [Micromonospora sp. RTGN7]|uniref:PadR family transcriptional regulator n=1 Tax=Micromonospora sp. RTGN7 TaxID=3016526 RepID=UPI0029FECCF7|nr:PadR family transcriptional regulator [Micromonospora sp. RTGN7]